MVNPVTLSFGPAELYGISQCGRIYSQLSYRLKITYNCNWINFARGLFSVSESKIDSLLPVSVGSYAHARNADTLCVPVKSGGRSTVNRKSLGKTEIVHASRETGSFFFFLCPSRMLLAVEPKPFLFYRSLRVARIRAYFLFLFLYRTRGMLNRWPCEQRREIHD